MTSNTTKSDSSHPAAETAVHLFDNWFDPIEAGLRERVRELIQTMIEGELDMVLSLYQILRLRLVRVPWRPFFLGVLVAVNISPVQAGERLELIYIEGQRPANLYTAVTEFKPDVCQTVLRCRFRRNPAGYSDVMPAGIPI
jgi:hypothetical protein